MMFGWLRRQRQRPALTGAALPPDIRVYAVGDIHGRADLLDRMLREIVADAAQVPPSTQTAVILLGDLIDRGMQSKDVVERALSPGLPPSFAFTVLMGNHERAMLDFLDHGRGAHAWLSMGGAATLSSYGCAPPSGQLSGRILSDLRQTLARHLPERHRQFLRNLATSALQGDYLFVHAGIEPRRTIETQRDADLLWIRKPFLEHPGPFEKVIVHGHNITMAPELLPHRIGIDTGAYATGLLSAIVLEGSERRILQVGAPIMN
jgi:serine/threonine protein phosphatase 1